jgi:hypothetical protein
MTFFWIVVYGNGFILSSGLYDDADICARDMRAQVLRDIQLDAANPRGFVAIGHLSSRPTSGQA